LNDQKCTYDLELGTTGVGLVLLKIILRSSKASGFIVRTLDEGWL
jgi:hypothetical protein